MSIIEKLSVTAVRNIDGLHMEPISTVNILHGENGSGKTSILSVNAVRNIDCLDIEPFQP